MRENYEGGERNRDVVICHRVSVRGKELSSSLYIYRPLVSFPFFFFQTPLSIGNPHLLEIPLALIIPPSAASITPLPPRGGEQSFRSASSAQENEEK